MKRHVSRVAIVGVSLLGYGCTETVQTCQDELSQEKLIEIAQEEKERRNYQESPKKEITIEREGCNYVYFEQRVPAVPGGHLEIRIDEFGKVIDYIPGL